MPDEVPILPAAQNQPIEDLQNTNFNNLNPKSTNGTLRNVESNVKFKGSIMPPTNRAFSEEA